MVNENIVGALNGLLVVATNQVKKDAPTTTQALLSIYYWLPFS